MDFRLPTMPDPPHIPVMKSIPEQSFEDLVEEIHRFQSRLSDEMELGIVANGAGLTIHVDRLQRSGQMIIFSGTVSDGYEARLIQHYTQINVQMVAVPKLDESPRRIGF